MNDLVRIALIEIQLHNLCLLFEYVETTSANRLETITIIN
jgi:hypothetical protein